MAAVASKPNFAVVCSFLERYGASLELPEFTFPELEEALENKKSVPQPLVDLHLKLMRKIGKSVSFDRWEKYLLRICLEYNNTWAWEMEKIGYTEMDAECKLGLLKYLCECQFDDNLKFKNVLNEEEPDAMRIHPIGRDKDGLMYWYQLDQEFNVRLYTEEQDDQDGTSWRLIVRDRNELAETLQLLKAQIDPALLSKFIQEDGSSHTSPTPEDEENKKEIEERLEEEVKMEETIKGQQEPEVTTQHLASSPTTTSPEDEAKIQTVKKETIENDSKAEQTIKIEQPALEKTNAKGEGAKVVIENNLDKIHRPTEEENIAAKVQVVSLKGSGDAKGCADKLAAVDRERPGVNIKVEPPDDVKEKSSEELERALKNVKQAKLPVKKREIKLTEDYDNSVKTPLGKPLTSVREPLKEGLKVEGDAVKQTPDEKVEGKQLMNGEIAARPQVNNHKDERVIEASSLGKVEQKKNQEPGTPCSTKEEENGINGSSKPDSDLPTNFGQENHASRNKVEVSQNCLVKEKAVDQNLPELAKPTEEARSKCEEGKGDSLRTKLRDKEMPDTKTTPVTPAEEEHTEKLPVRRTRASLRQQLTRKASEEEAPQKVEQAEEKRETEPNGTRCLRRSLRISKPTVKVTENLEKKACKREEPSVPQSSDKDENHKKVEKDSKGAKRKSKSSRRARWTKSRGRRRPQESSGESESAQEDDECSEEEEEEEEEGEGPPEDDEPCKKCGLSNHPELILLCDSCDSGYHTACLRPPLMTIPDGEWFCPPCQHKLLCEKLEEQLQNIDVMIKKKERAERRKERLAFVGINVENIIAPKDSVTEEQEIKDYKSLERRSGRTRRSINYRFDEFDDAIDEAIHEDIQEAEGKGAGRGKDMANITGQSLGKDISTILAGSKESKRPTREAACRRKKRRRLNDLDSDSTLEDDESEEEFRISESSEEEFEISDRDSEADPASNDDEGFEVRRGRHRKYMEPMRRSWRLRGRQVKRYSDEDEEDEEEHGESSRSRSSDEEQEDERPQRKRLNRIEDEEEDDDEDEDEPALTSRFRGRPARDYSKKYRLMSEEEEEELEEAGKEASSLDCGLVVLPSTNGQSAGQASEGVISRTSEKNQMAKDTNPTPSLALNGACEAMASEAGVEAGGDGGEEEEDDLLGVTDLVEYVCNNEQI
ncbi:remodeling and spacing factor 1 isoform X3 [Hemiscyllium ocellatum]|uniref:remodeling and spacing factor 1 isoform X3 n=1 Tax=Hemiscyllium ocellatum TaxID=170820 RepID=UPI002965F172|nr:remodeling and spacing factor 1 isoform X3 [Hemiscyllium ocellatum]